MGKFAKALGDWQHELGGIEITITPQMGDNDKVGKILSAYQSHKNQAKLLQEIRDLYFGWVVRDDSTLDDQDKQELRQVCEKYQLQIMEMIMIEFKWADEETMAKAKQQAGDQVKNLIEATD